MVYLAPETTRADPAYGPSLDVFSLGCIAFHIFSGGDANVPSHGKAEWVIRNLLASGLVKDPSIVSTERAADWFRADLFQKASRLLTTNNS